MTSAFGVNTEIMEQHSDWNCESLYFHRQRVNSFYKNQESIINVLFRV